MKNLSVVTVLSACAVFAIYFANVASGAFLGRLWLNDVSEMLVLVLACVLFVISTLLFERDRNRK